MVWPTVQNEPRRGDMIAQDRRARRRHWCVGPRVNQSPAGEALNVRIEAENHTAPFPNRFKFTISSFRLDYLLAKYGTALERILENDMCSDERFGFRCDPPSSGVRRSAALGEVNGVGIRQPSGIDVVIGAHSLLSRWWRTAETFCQERLRGSVNPDLRRVNDLQTILLQTIPRALYVTAGHTPWGN
jgi:hypothetical protein